LLFAGYEAIHRQTLRDYYVFQDEQAMCSSGAARYKWSLSQGNHYGVSDEFASAVCALPLLYDAQVYKEFLDTWGTVRYMISLFYVCISVITNQSLETFIQKLVCKLSLVV